MQPRMAYDTAVTRWMAETGQKKGPCLAARPEFREETPKKLGTTSNWSLTLADVAVHNMRRPLFISREIEKDLAT